MTDSLPTVAICGPASWNDIIVLDELPAPVPHMQFVREAWSTVGGTSAGKALHLASLGAPTQLHAFLADDDAGRTVARLLREAGTELRAWPSERTERHVNLMTPAGERVSLYVATTSPPSPGDLDTIRAELLRSEHAVIDLSEAGAALIATLPTAGARPTVWVDLHDYDGRSTFHEPFVRHADIVFMNADAAADPWALLESCVQRGPRLAVCTLGAEGAIARDAAGTQWSVAAAPAPHIVDTNGAGDAFMAGFLVAFAQGHDVPACLTAAAEQAATALTTRHLHPTLDSLGV